MNLEEKKLKILKACGFGLNKVGYTHGIQTQIPPDYFNDLNAVADAEIIILNNDAKFYCYRHHLALICGKDRDILASAEQRCEALIKVIELYID